MQIIETGFAFRSFRRIANGFVVGVCVPLKLSSLVFLPIYIYIEPTTLGNDEIAAQVFPKLGKSIQSNSDFRPLELLVNWVCLCIAVFLSLTPQVYIILGLFYS